MRFIVLLPVLLVGTLGCKSRVDKALNSPSVENAKSLWMQDRTELREHVAALDAAQRDAWADLFEKHLAELFGIAAQDPKAAVDDFCGFLSAVAASPPARDPATVRLRTLCDAAEHARDVKEQLARRRSDAEDSVKRARENLNDATAQLKDVQSGAHAVYQLSGMMIAALSDQRYEIAQFEARVIRDSYCAPGDDCSGQMALGVSDEHDILETTKTRFDKPGRIDPPLCVRSKGEETVKVNGFDKRVTVYEEVGDQDCGAGQVAAGNKRVAEARAALRKATNELQEQPLETLAATDYTTAKAAVLNFVKCVSSTGPDCQTEPKHAPDSPTQPSTTAQPVLPPDAGPDVSHVQPTPQALSVDAVQRLVKAQADSLTSTGANFIDSFDAHAVAFFPQSLTLYEGRDQIIEGSREAWAQHGAPDNVDASDVLVGVFPNFAWATAQWKVTLAGTRTVLPIRVTEVVVQDRAGLHVVAASFSVPPPAGVTGIGEPVPPIAGGVSPSDPETWLLSPKELAQHVRSDGATVLIGSDAEELALGADETRTLLTRWKNVKLEFAGKVRVIEGAGYRVVLGFARWRGSKPTLFRVLGLFVPSDQMLIGAEPWELATAHYSVASTASAANATASRGASDGETGVPECDAYLRAFDKYMSCDKIPRQAVEASKKGIEQMKAGWAMLRDPNMPAEAKKSAGDACREAVDALKQSAKGMGCPI